MIACVFFNLFQGHEYEKQFQVEFFCKLLFENPIKQNKSMPSCATNLDKLPPLTHNLYKKYINIKPYVHTCICYELLFQFPVVLRLMWRSLSIYWTQSGVWLEQFTLSKYSDSQTWGEWGNQLPWVTNYHEFMSHHIQECGVMFIWAIHVSP